VANLRVDPAGFPLIAATLLIALVSAMALGWPLAVAFALVGVALTLFFRDPDRHVPLDAPDDAVLSPADGRVLVAGPASADVPPPGAWRQISIFLSPLNVHVNRVPVSGRVTRVSFTPGSFLPAYRPDAARRNERSEIWFDQGGQIVVARQIVGVLARRVVCRLQAGSAVRAGDRLGIMKFGSRMDVFLPTTARILVTVGQEVRGGETVIAVLH
jgi:phosphatidylserine decarboxylase